MKQGKFGLEIALKLDSKKFEKEILKEAVTRINKYIQIRIKNLDKRIGDGFVERIKETPTYDSLISETGQLRIEFGLANPKSTMDNILAKLRLCFTTDFTKAKIVGGNKIEGNLAVKFNKPDFSFLYEEASFRSYFLGIFKRSPRSSYKSRGGKVDWLRWLLEAGTTPVITDHRIRFGNFESPEPSRTGGAIMVNGGTWHVPSGWGGTSSDNWLTRTLEAYDRDVQESLNQLITDAMSDVSK